MPTSAAETSRKVWCGVPAGFTLMELVVVIALLSLVAIIVFPRLSVSRTAELQRSARQLAATVRYLQDRAIATKTGYQLHLVLGGNTVAVKQLLPDGSVVEPGDPALRGPLLATGVIVSSVSTPRGGTRSAGEAVIPFGASGIGEFTAIHLKGADAAVVTVMSYPSSGRVTVVEGYREEAP